MLFTLKEYRATRRKPQAPDPPVPFVTPTRLVDGWEAVLLASLTSQRVVRGRVRANKLLAYMQLHGVPVPIRFRNIQMGPASFDVDTRAKVAAGAGLLELLTEKGRADIERHDYRTPIEARDHLRAQAAATA